jgi:hypothetical protein
MARFATGKNSYAISDRSGMRYRYKDMRKEWTGALVGRDEYEPKHPQLGPFKKVSDAEALKDARPDREEPLTVPVGAGGYPSRGYAVLAKAKVGTVTVVVS